MKLKTNFLPFFSEGKHGLDNPSPRSLIYNLYYYAMVVHLRIGVL
jgi:hypothetical protein